MSDHHRHHSMPMLIQCRWCAALAPL
jgi:hypothetical protein